MNKIVEVIKNRETEVFKFKPNRTFYRKVGINRKRWGQIYRGEVSPTITEAQRIAYYFDISLSELIKDTKNRDEP